MVVAHPGWIAETREIVEQAGLTVPIAVVAGGVTRNESTRTVSRRLDAADDDIVIVHDAVRPLVPVEVIQRSIEPILSGRADGTDTVIPSADTLVDRRGRSRRRDPRAGPLPARPDARRPSGSGSSPQAYETAAAAGDLTATDDCSLVLRHVPGRARSWPSRATR